MVYIYNDPVDLDLFRIVLPLYIYILKFFPLFGLTRNNPSISFSQFEHFLNFKLCILKKNK